jgi:hypothetical protein
MSAFFDLFAIAVLIALLGGVIGACIAIFLVPWRILINIGKDDDKHLL